MEDRDVWRVIVAWTEETRPHDDDHGHVQLYFFSN